MIFKMWGKSYIKMESPGKSKRLQDAVAAEDLDCNGEECLISNTLYS